MPVATYNYRDGDGGTYFLAVTSTVAGTRETVTEVTLDNTLRNYETHWTLDVNNKHFEGVVASGEAQTWSGLSERIDARDISWGLG
jgi:hypothetical protein